MEAPDANPFRVRAYRQAAATQRQLDRPAAAILEAEGVAGLTTLPSIGTRLGGAIADVLQTGLNRLLEELEGTAQPEQRLAGVPGIGPELARMNWEQRGTGW